MSYESSLHLSPLSRARRRTVISPWWREGDTYLGKGGREGEMERRESRQGREVM